MPAALRIQVLQDSDDAVQVLLSGELDIATGPLLRVRLDDLLDSRPGRPVRLVVDLGDLEFVDVVGLGVLLRVEREVAAAGGVVVLRRPAALVRRVIALLDLQDRLQLEG